MNPRGLFILSLATLGSTAFAITPDYGVVTFFKGIGTLSGASVVAIAPHYAITAKHVGGTTCTFDSGTFTAIRRVDCPDADISLLEFTQDLGTHYRLDSTYNLVGQEVSLVGFGGTGTAGATGINITGGGGVRRAANNVIDSLQNVSFDNVHFFDSWQVDVDGPTGNGSTGGAAVFHEGGLWGGDSGGAWLVNRSGEWKLVGVNSWIDDANGNNAYNDYGDWAGATAVGRYEGWIRQNSPVPEPASMMALGLGAATLLRKRRVK